MLENFYVKTLYKVPFTHNMMGDVYKSFLDFFGTCFPRVSWKVMGTYFKAIEYLNKKNLVGRETDMPNLPMIALNPSGEFVIEEKFGRMLWRFPDLLAGFTTRLYDPIYQDQHVKITPIFTRMRGDLEVNLICPSYYEYVDSKIELNLIFGSMERWIYPGRFNLFVILPASFENLIYSNDVTGQTYEVDLQRSSNKLIKTLAQDKLVIPSSIRPMFRVTGMTDQSIRLGGTSDVPTWHLGFTVEYEIEIPTQFIVETDYLLQDIDFYINLGVVYSKNSNYNSDIPPAAVSSFTAEYDWELADATDSTAALTPDMSIINVANKNFKTRYYHIVTQAEADSTADIEIALPEIIMDPSLLIIVNPIGILNYWDQYKIIGGDTLILRVQKLTLEAGQFLELYVYQYS